MQTKHKKRGKNKKNIQKNKKKQQIKTNTSHGAYIVHNRLCVVNVIVIYPLGSGVWISCVS